MSTVRFDQPFEIIVSEIEASDYRSIIDLCRSSKSFSELCKSPVIEKIINKKREENLSAKLSYELDGEAFLEIFLIDPISGMDNIISFGMYMDDSEVEGADDRLRKAIPGKVIRPYIYLSPNIKIIEVSLRDALITSDSGMDIMLNKNLLIRLLEEYRYMVRENVHQSVYIRKNGEIDKVKGEFL